MRKQTGILLCLFLVVLCCSVSALAAGSGSSSGMYYTAVNAEDINISEGGIYEIKLKTFDAKNAGWEWNVPAGTDVTDWFFNEYGEPAFADEKGVAAAAMDDSRNLTITIDTAKVSAFTHNGSFELRLNPASGTPLVPDANNHGQYTPETSTVFVGRVSIPTVSVEGRIEKENQDMKNDTVTVALTMDGLDDAKIDSSHAVVTLIPGDGYTLKDYAGTFPDTALGTVWSEGRHSYTVSKIDGMFMGWGGNGNGEFNINLGVVGLRYSGLPLSDGLIRVHIYSYSRTFSIETYGSLIYDTQPLWASTADGGVPVLCDPYPDCLTATWPIGFDASKLTAEDFVLTMKGTYSIDDLVLKPGEDYTVSYANNQTAITITYQYWPNFPVYTTLRVDVKLDNLKWDAEKYHPEAAGISHDYEIASVYAYYVMSGGQTGPQNWTFYGIELDSFQDVFHAPNYTLSITDSAGKTQFYAEDSSGTAYFTGSAEEAKTFEDLRPEIAYVKDNTATFVRQYDATDKMTVGGKSYTMNRNYETAETLLQNAAYGRANGVTAAPGYTIGETWSMHERWPWQVFIGIGYQGGSK